MSDIDTMLADSAAQVDRAAPSDERLKTEDWQSPGRDWFEAFVETFKRQLEASNEEEGSECPCCGICP